uniref:Uncharacterized protein n=1 Tax=Trichinella nativa TaxID=6335 RepID=A0A0V1KHT3_9BILA
MDPQEQQSLDGPSFRLTSKLCLFSCVLQLVTWVF